MTTHDWASLAGLFDEMFSLRSLRRRASGGAASPAAPAAAAAGGAGSTPSGPPAARPARPPLRDVQNELAGEVPYNESAERALLGSLLLENRLIAEATQHLLAEDFHLPAHRGIFRRIVAMDAVGQPVDLVTLSEELRRRNQLEEIGGAAYLCSLTEGVVLRDSLGPYLRIVRQKSGLRQLMRAAESVSFNARQPGATLEECRALWMALLDDRRLQLSNRLRCCEAEELIGLQLPPRGMVLDPVLPTQGLCMLYSPRGVGKTYIALAMAWAVASGSSFLRWRAPQPRKVLFVDGELPATTLQERLAAIRGASAQQLPTHSNLRLITPDLQEFGVPDVSTRAGQALIENELAGAELLVLDNLSALIRSGNENEGESWMPVAEWALRLRQRGISVLFLHHAGKSGAQRGTSRREDLLDTVIALKHPSDYCPIEGLRCVVRFEKARNFHGDSALPFELAMKCGEGGTQWSICAPTPDADPLLAAVASLARLGKSVREVAAELGISPTAAHRRLRQLRMQQELLEEPAALPPEEVTPALPFDPAEAEQALSA